MRNFKSQTYWDSGELHRDVCSEFLNVKLKFAFDRKLLPPLQKKVFVFASQLYFGLF